MDDFEDEEEEILTSNPLSDCDAEISSNDENTDSGSDDEDVDHSISSVREQNVRSQIGAESQCESSVRIHERKRRKLSNRAGLE